LLRKTLGPVKKNGTGLLRRSHESIAKQAVHYCGYRKVTKNAWKEIWKKEMWTAGFRYSWKKMEVAA